MPQRRGGFERELHTCVPNHELNHTEEELMEDNDACGPVAASSVLDALVRDETEPGYLQKFGAKAEVLSRVLEDAGDPPPERLEDPMKTLALIGEICREIEKSKLNGRFSGYP
jgi:hypothetical protein